MWRRRGAKLRTAAVASLVDALGQDLRELLSATQQIIADTTGTINEEDVRALYGGRSEVMPWDVADAAIAGQTGKALSLGAPRFCHSSRSGADRFRNGE
ncbi:Uncharacterised protein [Actinobaculum suis]|uniref:Uncharacterized protein n=2 Tax=Actinobaculum suis TaxID=1657 RepID=A0A7Z9C990_9ACTO|nr:Uncharacterised protein [Actinobaculum suis]